MFIIIDGSGLVCTKYYGSLPDEVKYARTQEEKEAAFETISKDRQGRYNNAITGYLQTLAQLINRFGPEHMAVCFDKSREGTFRREIFSDYKGQRAQPDLPLEEQMIALQKITEDLGIATFLDTKYEADDFAGSIAKKFASEDEQVVLITKDRDYYQLIDDNITTWMLTGESQYNKLVEKYGECNHSLWGTYEFDKEILKNELDLTPPQVVDWKAIAGDSSDNIPGIKNVGDKSIIPLLKEYGNIENMYQAMEESINSGNKEEMIAHWKNDLKIRAAAKCFERLIDGKEIAFLCKKLATIKTDLDISDNISDYEYPADLTLNGEYQLFYKVAREYDCIPLFDQLDMYINGTNEMMYGQDEDEIDYSLNI